jgi:hypothetical protein
VLDEDGPALRIKTEESAPAILDLDSENFAEYEAERSDLSEGEVGGLDIRQIEIGGYHGREYIEYSVFLQAVKYIVEKDSKYIKVSTESGLSDEQLAGLNSIISTLQTY